MAKRASSISERELWTRAEKVIDTYGADAVLYAKIRVDELLTDGDVEGQRVWKAVLARIIEWRRLDPPGLRH